MSQARTPHVQGEPGAVDLATVTGSDDPYRFWVAVRQERAVFYSEEHDSWLVTRSEDVRRVLSDSTAFSSRSAFTPHRPLPEAALAALGTDSPMAENPINLDPPRHTPIRRIWGRALMRRKVEGLVPKLRQTAEDLVGGFVADGRADLVSRFSNPYPAMIVLCTLLSVPPEELPQHVRWGHCIAEVLGAAAPVEELTEAARGIVEYQQYWRDQLEERMRSPRDDLLTAFIEECEADPDIDVDMEMLAYLPLGLATAGHVTTAQAISFGVLMFASHPEQRDSALGDLTVMATAVEEILRIESPAQIVRRTAMSDVDIAGTIIPEGAHVLAVVGSANHDPAAYDSDPETFDVCRRDAAEHLTFSHGAHYCIGATLARREIAIALEVLFTRLPNLRLATDGQVQRIQHVFHRGFERLDVEWDAPAA